MKHGLSRTLAIVGLGFTTFALTPVHAQTTAPGPYYPTPSWDQTIPASTRFIVLSNFNNQAVLDRETGVVWQRSPLGPKNWFLANAACIQSKVGNRAGWRLPTINELGSVLDPSATAGPAFPSGHPFTGFSPTFERMWAANMEPVSQSPGFATAGWTLGGDNAVFMVQLLGHSGADPTNQNQTWCVRGGLQPGPQ